MASRPFEIFVTAAGRGRKPLTGRARPPYCTDMHTLRLTVAALLSAFSLAASARAALCPGDCNGDGRVAINELVRGVTIAAGETAYSLCRPLDVNGDGQVSVDELVGAVGNALAECPASVTLFHAPEVAGAAGPLGDGRGVLPNGRTVAPAGRQVNLDTFPLNLDFTPDGRSLLVTNDGWGDEEGERGLQLVDLATHQSTRIEVPHFFGLAISPQGDRVFVADGDSNTINALSYQNGTLQREPQALAKLSGFPTALAVSPDGSHLYVIGLTDNSFRSIDLATRTVHSADNPVGNFPYTLILSADGTRAFVSSWGVNNGTPPGDLVPPLPPLDPNAETRSSVAQVDLTDPDAPKVLGYTPIARSLAIDSRTIFGGSHPSAMALSPDGQLLYVTATNLDLLVVLDAATLSTVAEIPLNPFESGPLPTQLQGLYPNALAVRADGRRVYVADAGINAVQVIDVDPSARTFSSAGFIPVGWFPSALGLTSDGTLYVANAKGAGIGPNGADDATLIDINETTLSDTPYYIGRLVKGSLSIIDGVDDVDLTAGTTAVQQMNGLAPAEVRWVDGAPGAGEVERGLPVPIDFGSGPSDQIKHVVFILKENRTYDQVFGDIPEGNGDPRLVLFGQHITPNQHALARQFAMGDNFYCDAEVSITGHEWTDQANSTDFTEKLWPRNYNGNLSSLVIQFGQEGFAKSGYLFEALERQGVSFRVYGETFYFLTRYVAGIDGGGPQSLYPIILDAFGGTTAGVLAGIVNLVMNADIPALEAAGVKLDVLRTQVWPNMMLDYPANILANRTDAERAQLFLSELQQYEQNDNLPSFIFIWLPNDHTFGAAPSMPTPDSAVADNDDGLGRIVDGLSHSRFWPQTAIFVNEDDAQDGQDHVSAHRSLGLVISPYVKHGYISHVHHSNISMFKTMELLLGVQALTEYDRAATDMRDYFTSEPDLTPYAARPRQVALRLNLQPEEAPNAYLRRAAELSEHLNLSTVDEAGENLGRVLWLAHAGDQLERTKMYGVAVVCLLVGAMLAGGLVIGRRHAARTS
jgi:DNA-binding beta-propeller fold protein YncE